MRKITFKPYGWPWQVRPSCWSSGNAQGSKWGWRTPDGMGRFGGGWRWKLGIIIGRSECIVDLVFGGIRISWRKEDNK